MRLTGCSPFYGDDYDEIVEKNLKAELNYNFSLIGLKFESLTLDLLKGLLKKSPKARLSAAEALRHPAFNAINSSNALSDDTTNEDLGLHQNLREFHEKYGFD
jgi:serine/threonine protein kinase